MHIMFHSTFDEINCYTLFTRKSVFIPSSNPKEEQTILSPEKIRLLHPTWKNQAVPLSSRRQRYSTIHKKIKLFHHPKRGQAFPSSPKKNQTLPSSKIKSGYSIIQNKFKLSNHPNKTSGYSIIPKIRLSQHPKENYEEIRLGNSQH